MCVAEQTSNGAFADYLLVNVQRLMDTIAKRVIVMKYALMTGTKDLTLRPIHRDLHGPRVSRESARIQGGNWKMQGLRRSGSVHDEAECQMSIAEFIAEQGLPRDEDLS